jgi:LysR family glycine cleavage system transcriptional activator
VTPRPLAHLNAIRAFEAAARHLSYARAAAELGVTAAAVGQQVRMLEAWLGTTLFHRSPGPPIRLALTESARAALPDLTYGLERLAAGERRLRQRESPLIVTVTSSPAFAAKWLLPRLERFREAHPQLDVRIDATDRLADFASGGVDVGIRYGGGNWPGLTAVRLMDEEVFPVCSPKLLDGARPIDRPDDLSGHVLIHDATIRFDTDFPDWRVWLRNAGASDVDPEKGLSMNSSAAVAQAALEGHGVALARSVVVADDLAAGRLIRLFAHLACPVRWGYYVVHRADDNGLAKLATFRDWLIAECRDRLPGAHGAHGTQPPGAASDL